MLGFEAMAALPLAALPDAGGTPAVAILMRRRGGFQDRPAPWLVW